MSKIECLTGRIICGFVRTEYLLSQVVAELGIEGYRTYFFANSRTSKKLKGLIPKLSATDIKNKELYIKQIRIFDELREQRNIIVHGLVLINSSNKDEFKFHSYIETKNGIKDQTQTYSLGALLEIEKRIIDVHNDLVDIHFK